MTTYRRFITPLVLVGGTVAASAFALLMGVRLRTKQEARRKAALDNWEDEGGSAAPSGVAEPPS